MADGSLGLPMAGVMVVAVKSGVCWMGAEDDRLPTSDAAV